MYRDCWALGLVLGSRLLDLDLSKPSLEKEKMSNSSLLQGPKAKRSRHGESLISGASLRKPGYQKP